MPYLSLTMISVRIGLCLIAYRILCFSSTLLSILERVGINYCNESWNSVSTNLVWGIPIAQFLINTKVYCVETTVLKCLLTRKTSIQLIKEWPAKWKVVELWTNTKLCCVISSDKHELKLFLLIKSATVVKQPDYNFVWQPYALSSN